MDERYDWELSEKALGLRSGAPGATKEMTSDSRRSVIGAMTLLVRIMWIALR